MTKDNKIASVAGFKSGDSFAAPATANVSVPAAIISDINAYGKPALLYCKPATDGRSYKAEVQKPAYGAIA